MLNFFSDHLKNKQQKQHLLLAAVAGLDKSVSALVDLSWVEVCESQRVQTPVMRTERTCGEGLIDDSCAVASILQSIFALSHL